MNLRPEQNKVIEDCLSSIMFGSRNVILDLHTSFGKSLVMSELAKQLDGRIVIMVNITPLIDQIAEHLDEIGLEYSILKADMEDRFDDSKRVQLVMSQTFYARMDTVNIHADYFIQDEVHREYDTDRTTSLLNHLDNPIRIGLTGTAMDSKGYGLSNAEVLVGSSISNSEEKGYIVPLKYYIPKWSMKVNYDNVAMSGSDYSSVSLNEVLCQEEHINLVVESMNQMNAKDKKTLVFCNSIEHCDAMTIALKRAGYNAECTHSKMDSKHNDEVMLSYSSNKPIPLSNDDLFESGNETIAYTVKCLLSVSKLNVGFSVKDIQLGVMLRPTLVRSLWIQTCGRLIREDGSKEYAEMLDLAGCTSEHGFHSTSYIAPELGDRKTLARIKSEMSLPEIALLCESEPTEILASDVKLKVEELNKAKQELEKETDIDRLNYLFEASDSCFEVVRISGIIGNRFRNLPPMSEANCLFVSDVWEELIEANPIYKTRILKTFKTMCKNKIRDSKKLVALHYSIDWICEVNSFYINPKEL